MKTNVLKNCVDEVRGWTVRVKVSEAHPDSENDEARS